MWTRRGFLAGAAAGLPAQDGRAVEVRVIDGETRRPTAARVRLIDAHGRDIAPIGHPPEPDPKGMQGDVLFHGKRYSYVNGGFAVRPDQLPLRYVAIKGFEYEYAEGTIPAPDPLGNPADIRLAKWSAWKRRGWLAGDTHIHHISPHTCKLEMEAEDLDVANILTSDFTSDEHEFEGRLNRNSTRDRLIYVSQEFRHNHLGHISMLNLKKLIRPVRPMRKEHFPLHLDACDNARKQGGYVAWAHFPSWPGLENPLDVALEKLDGVELLCVLDPREFPVFVRSVVPELAANDGLRLWYRYLNCGFRLTAVAGTDKMTNWVTAGANRVYAKVDGEFTYGNWIAALKRGATFVSNSPLMTFTVDGRQSGSVIDVNGKERKARIHAEAESQLPYDRLEIVANGTVVHDATPSGPRNRSVIQMEYPVDRSCWIAARVVEDLGKYRARRVDFTGVHSAAGTRHGDFFGTRRPETVFAHTTPVYVLHDGRPIRSAEDAGYWIRYLEASRAWLDKNGNFARPSDKKATLEAFEAGIAAYRRRMP